MCGNWSSYYENVKCRNEEDVAGKALSMNVAGIVVVDQGRGSPKRKWICCAFVAVIS